MRAKGVAVVLRGAQKRTPNWGVFPPWPVLSAGGLYWRLFMYAAVDSASPWAKLYGLRRISDSLVTTKRLLVDTGQDEQLNRMVCFVPTGAPCGRQRFSAVSATATTSL